MTPPQDGGAGQDAELERALETVKAAGYVVLKAKSYRQAQERQRVAEAHREWETERRESAERWARDCLTEERRLRERLVHVYGVAQKFGATTDDLRGPAADAPDDVRAHTDTTGGSDG